VEKRAEKGHENVIGELMYIAEGIQEKKDREVGKKTQIPQRNAELVKRNLCE